MQSVFLPHKNQGQLHRVRAVVSIAPVTSDNWPIWAAALAFFKSEADVGVGDTVERIIGHSNSASFQKWHLKTFGKTCGCSGRKAQWNAKFPYVQH